MEQQLVGIPGAGGLLGGVCRTTVYKLVNDGELELVKIGRRSFITGQSLTAYVERLKA